MCAVNVYWLSGGAAVLTDALVKEVREALRRGEGLILDGAQDARSEGLHAAAGIQVQGAHPTSGDSINPVADSSLPAGSFTPGGALLQLSATGSTNVLARYEADGSPALTLAPYGRGRAVFAAYDLLGHLGQSDEATAALARALITPLAHHGDPLTVGDGIAFATTVTNPNAQVVTVEVRAVLPAGTEFIGASHSTASHTAPTATAAGAATWQLPIPAGASATLTVTLRIAQSLAQVSLPIEVHRQDAQGTWIRDASVDVPQSVRASAAQLDEASQVVNALNPASDADRQIQGQIRQAIQQAGDAQRQADYAGALNYWLSAADLAQGFGSLPADVRNNVQQTLAWALEAVADSQCRQAGCIVGWLTFEARDIALRDTLHWSRVIRNNCPEQIKDIETTARLIRRRDGYEALRLWDNLTIPGLQQNERGSGWQADAGSVVEGDLIDVSLSADWQGLVLPLATDPIRIIAPRLQ
jgi:hypothetical protein